MAELTTAAFEARGLVKRFGPRLALGGVDLRLEPGHSLALVGPNGAGKTTLLRVLAGTLSPTSGSLRVFGHDARRDRRNAFARVGLVSHASLLYDDLTAIENVAFFARLYGIVEPTERALAVLEGVGVAHRAEDKVSELSRGLRQRVSLARALVHDPALLLLDEPFAGLDPRGIDLLCRSIETWSAAGRAIVLVAHDVERALSITRAFAVLDRGGWVDGGDSSAQQAIRVSAALHALGSTERTRDRR